MLIRNFDWIILSGSHPNEDENVMHASNLNPRTTKTVTINGAGIMSRFKRFVLINGNTTLTSPGMLDFRIMIPEKVKMIQFSAYDPITGLTTGNGGIQIWDKKFAEDFEGDIEIDHENIFVADDTLGAVVVNNTTPEQAYTEAYKEVGKLLSGHDRNSIWNLFADIPCKIDKWKSEIVNAYLTMGMDVPNGEWSIIGARHALLEVIKHGSVNLDDIKLKQDTIENTKSDLVLYGIHIINLSAEQSLFTKKLTKKPPTQVDSGIPWELGAGGMAACQTAGIKFQPSPRTWAEKFIQRFRPEVNGRIHAWPKKWYYPLVGGPKTIKKKVVLGPKPFFGWGEDRSSGFFNQHKH